MNDHHLTYVVEANIILVSSGCCGTKLIRGKQQLKSYRPSVEVYQILSKCFDGNINPDEIDFLRERIRVVSKIVVH